MKKLIHPNRVYKGLMIRCPEITHSILRVHMDMGISKLDKVGNWNTGVGVEVRKMGHMVPTRFVAPKKWGGDWG